jgi:hypothetical protein
MKKLHFGKLGAVFAASFAPAAWAVVADSVNRGHVGTDTIVKAGVAGLGSSIVAVSALLTNAYKETPTE